MKFRKKPVTIHAWQVKRLIADFINNPKSLPQPIQVALNLHRLYFENTYATIETWEGTHKANIDDWIIEGIKGELYPCKPEIFHLTYEPAEPHTPHEFEPWERELCNQCKGRGFIETSQGKLDV